ncbi:RNA-guided endonuclease TnpB family protein [Longispora sp. NPDC051575]|uniref:RNA-guided endonuclease InsQ/TnpB family protein n=1 Tax=Longispora sp. NPDC051575 TaxID=3154943 RepID=UPI003417CBA6
MKVRYRYRVEPTPQQSRDLARVFGCARVVYNDAIRLREQVRAAGGRIGPTAVQAAVTARAKVTPERAWLVEVSSDALIQAVRDCNTAYANFFASLSGKRAGRRMGAPRLRSRKDNRQSVRFSRNGFRLGLDGRLYVAKIGSLKVRWSRDLPSEPSSVTIIREADGKFYASFVVERDPTPLPGTDLECGLDLGLTTMAVVADTEGCITTVANPRQLARRQRHLRRVQRQLCRKKKGSSNRAKARLKVAKVHGKIRRARADHHHKLALVLVRDNQVVHVENLNIAGMIRNRRLARAISDAAWGLLISCLKAKAEQHGRIVHVVDRWLPSSKTCSQCGHKLAALALTVRAWTCPTCGAEHDRDGNAAVNILAAGQAERRNACGAHVRLPSGAATGVEARTTPIQRRSRRGIDALVGGEDVK